MRAGKLDRSITVERVSYVDDGAGNQIEHWAELAAMRAQIVEQSTDEFMRNWGASSETVIAFRTRYLDGVTVADRVVYDGTPYAIVQTKDIGRQRGLELRCKAIG